jgi:hypothetical protein
VTSVKKDIVIRRNMSVINHVITAVTYTRIVLKIGSTVTNVRVLFKMKYALIFINRQQPMGIPLANKGLGVRNAIK